MWATVERVLLVWGVGENRERGGRRVYDRRVCDGDERRYLRLYFVLQFLDFLSPYEIGRKYVETAPHGAVICTHAR